MPLDGTTYKEPEVVRVLRAAQKLINSPENWCQGALALDEPVSERSLDPRSQDAVKWCVRGAVMHVSGIMWPVHEIGFLDAAAFDLYRTYNSAAANNEHDHTAALAILDRAIEIALERVEQAIRARAAEGDG